jgi:3-dehydroquinate dehydratase / shikimate dehydrogenase
MIVLSVTGPGYTSALKQLRSSERYADMVEFRLDLIGGGEIGRLLRATRKPRIVTCRPVWEGGRFAGGEDERLEILEAASLLGAEYVDLELGVGRQILDRFRRRRRETRLIVSRHFFAPHRPDVREAYEDLCASGGDVLKLAYMANDVADTRLAFEFLTMARRDRKKGVAIAMGEAGELSRILYRKFGGWATYAAPDEGRGAAPGQIPASLMRGLYRAPHLTRATRVFGVLGYPVGHSKGVFVHNPLLQRHRLNAVYCRFPSTDLRRFFEEIMPLISGCSVTLPFKEEVAKFLDVVDDRARQIGAVNTVYRRKGRLHGTNTDAPAALDGVERIIKVAGRRMLVLGAGGAARAIVFEARSRGAQVVVTNRTTNRARRLAAESGVGFMEWRDVRPGEFDVLVNATPVGMFPDVHSTPLPLEGCAGMVVFDAVYNPPVTRFLREAQAAGARTVPGTEMYIRQGARQFRLFHRVSADLRLMRRLLEKASRTEETRRNS